jgi:DNA (cytosine-5)-methyltransferase 1
VFVVGYLGDWKPAAEVLFESESLRRDTTPSRKQREEVAGTVASRFGISSGTKPNTIATLCATDSTKWGSNQWVNEGKAILQPIAIAENIIGRQPHNGSNGDGYSENSPMYTLNATGVHGVAQPMFVDTYNGTIQGDTSATLTADMAGPTHTGPKVMQSNMAVRRLTPVECERLQGFPDNYTNISYRNKPDSPDGPRYKSLGNSMAVPVMSWIGKRIEIVNKNLNNED